MQRFDICQLMPTFVDKVALGAAGDRFLRVFDVAVTAKFAGFLLKAKVGSLFFAGA